MRQLTTIKGPAIVKNVELDIRILGTGSKNGNCVVINNEIMLDAGVNALREKFLNKQPITSLLSLKTIFISHAHNDHCEGLSKDIDTIFPDLTTICYPLLYDSKRGEDDILIPSQRGYIDTIPFNLRNKQPQNCEILYRFDVGHDVPCDGYVIWYQGKLILYATDIGMIDNVAIGYNYDVETLTYTFYTFKDICDARESSDNKVDRSIHFEPFDIYFVECNYDLETLKENWNKATSHAHYYKRAKQVHNSSNDCERYLLEIGNKPAILVHRSAENLPVTPETYKFILDSHFSSHWYVAISPIETVDNYSEKEIKDYHLVNTLKLTI